MSDRSGKLQSAIQGYDVVEGKDACVAPTGRMSLTLEARRDCKVYCRPFSCRELTFVSFNGRDMIARSCLRVFMTNPDFRD
jgi:hypothetical protein